MKRILGVLLSATMILVMAAGGGDQSVEEAAGNSGEEVEIGRASWRGRG